MTINELLRHQDGLITRAQAMDAGMTKAAIEYRLARGDWKRVRPGVFRSTAHPFTARTRVRAEMLWLGPDATLVGTGAAWWWRMTDEPPATVRIAVGAGRRVRSRSGMVTERRDPAPDERVIVDGIAVTTRAATVVDAARELGIVAGADLMDRALLRRRVTLPGILAAYRGWLGRPGSKTVATLVRLAAGGARFAAERRLARLLREGGIGGWVANHPVTLAGYGAALLDVAFVDRRVVVEVDGWAYHRDLDAFRRDPRRQNALVLAGWTVLRVTWHDLVSDPERVVAQIAAVLVDDRQDGSVLPTV
jgi:very-short-patch-repair endonuclease